MSDPIRREDALRVTLAYSSSYSAEQAETAIRALPAVQPDADELVGHMTKLIAAGLDRVEQLTAELADAEALIEAQAKDHASNNIRFAEAEHRAEVAEAERDKAYARGYSDAETEISKSALGQRNAFLHSQYANAADHIKVLTEQRDRLQAQVRFLERKVVT